MILIAIINIKYMAESKYTPKAKTKKSTRMVISDFHT